MVDSGAGRAVPADRRAGAAELLGVVVSQIKFKSVTTAFVYFATTEDGQHFRRDINGHWEQCYGDTWEPADAESIELPLEKAFKSFMNKYHE